MRAFLTFALVLALYPLFLGKRAEIGVRGRKPWDKLLSITNFKLHRLKPEKLEREQEDVQVNNEE